MVVIGIIREVKDGFLEIGEVFGA
jgi:hypothetical protein